MGTFTKDPNYPDKYSVNFYDETGFLVTGFPLDHVKSVQVSGDVATVFYEDHLGRMNFETLDANTGNSISCGLCG